MKFLKIRINLNLLIKYFRIIQGLRLEIHLNGFLIGDNTNFNIINN